MNKIYHVWDINEIMYYCDELEYVTVIMIDDTIFRFSDLDKFVKWYLLLKGDLNVD